MVDTWNNDQVADLTRRTSAGSIRWTRHRDGKLHTDHKDKSLALRQDEDGRHTLASVQTGATVFVVLAESQRPGDIALAELWTAAQAAAR